MILEKTTHRDRWVLLGLLFLFVWVLARIIPNWFAAINTPDFSDLNVFYTGGAKALAHHTLYDVQGHYQFKNAPFIGIIWGLVFSQFNFESLTWVYYFVLFAAWMAIAFLYYIWAEKDVFQNPTFHRWSWKTFGVSTLLLFAFFGRHYAVELRLGQVNAWVMGLLALFTYGLEKRWKPIWVGALLSLAIQIKLYALFLGPALLFQKRYRVIISTGFWIFFLNYGVLGLFHGFDFSYKEMIDWLVSLRLSSIELLFKEHNVSLVHFYEILFGNVGNIAIWLWAASYFLFLIPQWAIRNTSPLHQLAFALTGVAILNPLSWPYWVLFLIPAFMIMLNGTIKRSIEPSMNWLWIPIFFLLFQMEWRPLDHYWRTALLCLCCATYLYLNRNTRSPAGE